MEFEDYLPTHNRPGKPVSETRTRKLREAEDELSALDASIDANAAREEELGHARSLRAAREALVGLFHELPPEACRYVVQGAPSSPRSGKRWPLEFVESCYERLVVFDASSDDPEVGAVRARADREKRIVDRSREALVMGNLYIVPHIVKRFNRGSIPFGDLVQEGHVGLIKAVDRFDPDRGYRFSTYAYWWIRRSLSEAFSNRSRLIRLPESLREKLRTLRRTTEQLEDELGRQPTPAELAERMNVTPRKIKKLLNVVPEPSPIEELAQGYDEGWGAVLGETETEDPLERTLSLELKQQTDEAMELLDPREREVIRLRFGFDDGEDLTLSQIGKVIGLSRERVRQIERGALVKLHGWAARAGVGVC